jgi:hypothetical protein
MCDQSKRLHRRQKIFMVCATMLDLFAGVAVDLKVYFCESLMSSYVFKILVNNKR